MDNDQILRDIHERVIRLDTMVCGQNGLMDRSSAMERTLAPLPEKVLFLDRQMGEVQEKLRGIERREQIGKLADAKREWRAKGALAAIALMGGASGHKLAALWSSIFGGGAPPNGH